MLRTVLLSRSWTQRNDEEDVRPPEGPWHFHPGMIHRYDSPVPYIKYNLLLTVQSLCIKFQKA